MGAALRIPEVYTPALGARFRLDIGPRLLGVEGGHANHAADRGGETKHGISLRFLKAEGRIDLNGDGFADYDLDFDGDIDGADIRLLTAEDALDLGELCFWLRFKLWKLPQPLDEIVFDQAFNGGAKAAVKLLQRTLNSVFRTYLGLEPLKIDGVLGPQTFARAWLAMEKHPLEAVSACRKAAADRYIAIVAADPSQRVFLAGWLNRAHDLGGAWVIEGARSGRG